MNKLTLLFTPTPLPSLYINPRLEQPLLSFKSHAFWKNLSALTCGLNDGGGCALLGFMYERGKGVKQDDFKALKFFQKK
jgi:TPR repeat protein